MLAAMNKSEMREIIESAASSQSLIEQRFELARLASEVFQEMASFPLAASETHPSISFQDNEINDNSLLDDSIAVAMLL
jgi:hypothetical protein